MAAGDLLLVKCNAETLADLRDDLDVVLVEFSVEELLNLNPQLVDSDFHGGGFVCCVWISADRNFVHFGSAVNGCNECYFTATGGAGGRSENHYYNRGGAGAGCAMEMTGAATYLATLILALTGTANPTLILSAFFLLVALMSNIISTKTCAVLFAPIGLHIGAEIGIDPRIFAITIVFAANCAFATPFAYQTSLLVMGPEATNSKTF